MTPRDLMTILDGKVLTQVGPDVWTPLVYIRLWRGIFGIVIRPVCEDCP